MDYLTQKKKTLKISVNYYLIDVYNLNIEVVKSVHKSLFEYFFNYGKHPFNWLTLYSTSLSFFLIIKVIFII